MQPIPMTSPAPERPQAQFYTVKEAAAILKISDDTLYRMMDQGLIGFSRVSKRIRRISQKAIDKFAERGY